VNITIDFSMDILNMHFHKKYPSVDPDLLPEEIPSKIHGFLAYISRPNCGVIGRKHNSINFEQSFERKCPAEEKVVKV
jgi:hypothetical protein